MKREQDEAYVLRTQVLGEADLIVSLFALRHGRVRGVARSARRSRRRFGSAVEPLTRVQATWTEREGRDLHRLESLETVRTFAAMQAEPVRQATCAIFSEVTESFTHEGQAEERAFRLLGAVLEALELGVAPLGVVRYFEFWTLKLHGVLPSLEQCAVCEAPLPATSSPRVAPGGVHCDDCSGAEGSTGPRLGPADRAFLAHMRGSSPGDLQATAETVRAGGAVETLLRGALESFAERPIRSYRHLGQVIRVGDPRT